MLMYNRDKFIKDISSSLTFQNEITLPGAESIFYLIIMSLQ